ncbi:MULTISPECIES: hypothetical protein [unclassified Streptomyces]|nr:MULTISPECIES: hypothetical protein [unclassified Streptomyces]MCX4883272.1 hypothetical protein [Streptomyces sp. NBC_00847]MCX5423294.1 hypothetical protein [Streptomyces sp. NBC_00078]
MSVVPLVCGVAALVAALPAAALLPGTGCGRPVGRPEPDMATASEDD